MGVLDSLHIYINFCVFTSYAGALKFSNTNLLTGTALGTQLLCRVSYNL